MKIYEKSLNEMKKIVARYTEQTIDFEIEKTVSEIIQNVAQNGDQAVRDYERKFDSVNPTNKKLKTALLTSAHQASCAGKRLRHWPAWGCMYQAERQPILQLF